MAGSGKVAADWSHIRVLVADDDKFVTDMVLHALNKLAITRVRIAHEGGTAIDIFRQNPDIGLIISDWSMPGADGYTFLQAVRQVKPEVPFFMLTSNITEDYVRKALRAGVDGYIAKPFRLRNFQDKILTVLSQRYGPDQAPTAPRRAFGVER